MVFYVIIANTGLIFILFIVKYPQLCLGVINVIFEIKYMYISFPNLSFCILGKTNGIELLINYHFTLKIFKIGQNYFPTLKLKWPGGIFFQDAYIPKENSCLI